ncbi:MAG: GntR family transcriptional regulator, partial [bacterium]
MKLGSSEGKDKGSNQNEIFTWIATYIEKNGVDIGDPLPAEDFIVQQTKMSRNCVREALSQLRALGIIDSRKKRGMRLRRSMALLGLIRVLTQENPPQGMVGHMGAFRCAVEIGLAPEVFRRATNQDIMELRRIYED